MSKLEEYKGVISSLNEDMNAYKSMSTDNGPGLNELLKDISSRLYYLETIRCRYHDLWQTRVKQLINNDSSVSRAENFAHVDYPQMYELRHIMTGAYGVVGAIRSNLSYLKKEMETINTQ